MYKANKITKLGKGNWELTFSEPIAKILCELLESKEMTDHKIVDDYTMVITSHTEYKYAFDKDIITK